MTGAAEAVLRRHRGVTIAGLIAVAALAWTWIASGAGMGMNMAVAWDAERVLLTLAMWWVMMIAMMVPAAAPTVLLYAKSAQKPHSGAFLFGYLLVLARIFDPGGRLAIRPRKRGPHGRNGDGAAEPLARG